MKMDMLNDTPIICDSPLPGTRLNNKLPDQDVLTKIPDKSTMANPPGKVLKMEYKSPLAHFGKNRSRKRLSALLDDSVIVIETPRRKKRKKLRRSGKSLSEAEGSDSIDDSVIILSDSEIEKNHENTIASWSDKTRPASEDGECTSKFEQADIIIVDYNSTTQKHTAKRQPTVREPSSSVEENTMEDNIQNKLDSINIMEDIPLISNLHLGTTRQNPISIDLEVQDAESSSDTGTKPEDVAVVWTSAHSPLIKSKHAARASDASSVNAKAQRGNMVIYDTNGDFANLHRIDLKSRKISKKQQGTIGSLNPNWTAFTNNSFSDCTLRKDGPSGMNPPTITSKLPIPESAVKPPGTLREIVIDGTNIAMAHRNGKVFSETGLKIVIDYFKKRGHTVKAFVPQHRRSLQHQLLEKLYTDGIVVFTPSRRVQGRMITPYDDRYILEYATLCGGIVVSLDQYRDLYAEKPEWRDTIEHRLLAPTFVGDHVMFPEDPLGRNGPKLEQFLRH